MALLKQEEYDPTLSSQTNPQMSGREIILDYLGETPTRFRSALRSGNPFGKFQDVPYAEHPALQRTGEEILGDNPFSPGDLAMIPTAKNFGKFLTLWRKEKEAALAGGLKDWSGAPVDPTSTIANMYSWMRARRPKLTQQKHVGDMFIVDTPPDPVTGITTAGTYADRAIVEEMKKEALKDPQLLADIQKTFGISDVDEMKPWINVNRALESHLDEAAKTMTEEYFHGLQDIKGRLPGLGTGQRAYKGRAAKMALPHEAAADRAAETGFKSFEKFAELVKDPNVSPQQKVRYLNILENVPEFFNEADELVYYPKGTFSGHWAPHYEEMRQRYKPKPGWLKKKKFR